MGSSRGRYLIAFGGLTVAVLVLGGLLRHARDPERFPLLPRDRAALSTWGPGTFAYRTWWHWGPIRHGDLDPVARAARGWLDDRRFRAYRPEELERAGASFVYSPVAAALTVPFVLDRPTDARAAARVAPFLHLLALGALAALAAVAFRGRPATRADLALFALHAALCFPLARALQLTQTGIWIFAALSAAAFLLDRSAHVAAGLCLALGVSIKPHLLLVPLALGLAPGFPRRALWSCATGLAAAAGLALAWVGPDALRTWLLEVLPSLSSGFAYHFNQSVTGLLLRAFTDEPADVFRLAPRTAWIQGATIAFGLAVFAFAVAALRRPGRGGAPLLAYAVAVAAATVTGPVVWTHHLVLLAVPAAVAVRTLRTRPDARGPGLELGLLASWVLAATYVDGSGATGVTAALSAPGLVGALGLLAGLAALDRRAATAG